jgi:aconitate hydratase
MFMSKYADVFTGPKEWQEVKAPTGKTYQWQSDSTYVRLPNYFDNMGTMAKVQDITGARILALLGDSITTDHISPAGNIAGTSPAAKYLEGNKVVKADFNSYGARRGNHEVMMRGTFANTRIKNELVPGTEGGVTKYLPTGEQMSIYDAAMKYQADNTPLVIFAGKEYGTGSSRDWAAKGTALLGVKAVIAESFERIHRSNLVGMGIVPITFKNGDTRQSLGLDGSEIISIKGMENLAPRKDLTLVIEKNGSKKEVSVLCRIDTVNELEYYFNGGILRFVLKNLAA